VDSPDAHVHAARVETRASVQKLRQPPETPIKSADSRVAAAESAAPTAGSAANKRFAAM
jgi:hypothetical protein